MWNDRKNVNRTEALISTAAGAALAGVALRRADRWSLAIAAAGGILLYRGVTRRCPLFAALGVSTIDRPGTGRGRPGPNAILPRIYGDGTRDIVEEASWESFPASDAPAW